MTIIRAPEHEVLLKSTTHKPHEIAEWCTENFGPRWEAIGNRSGVWTVFWAGREDFGSYRWCFTNEKDLVLFMLRWS